MWGVDDLTVSYGDRSALDAVTVAVRPGAVSTIIGGDGAGKTTLLRVLAGLRLPGQRGRVRLPAQERIAYVPTGGGTFPDLTVDENLELIASSYHLLAWRPRAAELLDRIGLPGRERQLARQLSGGQRRKLAGAMALLVQPELLLLDEVTTGVDPVSRMELWRLVATSAAGGAAVVAATTYLDEAERAEHVVLLHDGRVLAAGTPAEVVASIPGHVVDIDRPVEPARAWRRGVRWREWLPAGTGTGPDTSGSIPAAVAPTLEDAAIVHELIAGGAA